MPRTYKKFVNFFIALNIFLCIFKVVCHFRPCGGMVLLGKRGPAVSLYSSGGGIWFAYLDVFSDWVAELNPPAEWVGIGKFRGNSWENLPFLSPEPKYLEPPQFYFTHIVVHRALLNFDPHLNSNTPMPIYLPPRPIGWVCRVPWWSIFVLSCAATLLFMLPNVLIWWRLSRRPGACPVCGYDIRATPERCPECGNANPMATVGATNVLK